MRRSGGGEVPKLRLYPLSPPRPLSLFPVRYGDSELVAPVLPDLTSPASLTPHAIRSGYQTSPWEYPDFA